MFSSWITTAFMLHRPLLPPLQRLPAAPVNSPVSTAKQCSFFRAPTRAVSSFRISALPIKLLFGSLSAADGREALRRLEVARGIRCTDQCVSAIAHRLMLSNASGIALSAQETGLVMQLCRCAACVLFGNARPRLCSGRDICVLAWIDLHELSHQAE